MKLIQIVEFGFLVLQIGKSLLIVGLVRLYWTTHCLDESEGGREGSLGGKELSGLTLL